MLLSKNLLPTQPPVKTSVRAPRLGQAVAVSASAVSFNDTKEVRSTQGIKAYNMPMIYSEIPLKRDEL